MKEYQSKPVTQRVHLLGNILSGMIMDLGSPGNEQAARRMVRAACDMANMALATIAEDGRKFKEEREDGRGNQDFAE